MAQSTDVIRTIKLTFVSDFWCPWCYIGFREIIAAMNKCKSGKLPVVFDFEYRPFLLNPTLSEDVPIPRMEYLQNKFGHLKAEMITKMIAERARAVGIEHLAGGPIRSTLRAHRLMVKAHALGGKDAQMKLLARVFKAYSEEARDIGDIDTLAELAHDVNIMSRDEAAAFLESDELTADVTAMVDKSRLDGVTGVPFTIVDGKWAISGGQTPDVYYQIFSKLAGMPADSHC